MRKEPNTCSHEDLPDWDGWYQCRRKVKVERNGKWYCDTHDPVRIAAKLEKEEARSKARRELAAEKRRRIAAEHSACEDVATEDLRPGLLAELLAEKSKP